MTQQVFESSFKMSKIAFETVTTTEGKAKLFKILGGLGMLAGLGYLGYMLIDPKVKVDKINNTNYLITSVAKGSNSDTILITYEPSQDIDPSDVVKLSHSFLLTNNIVKTSVLEISKIVNSAQIEVKTKTALISDISKSLNSVPSTEFKYGLIKIETTYNTQLKKDTQDLGKTIGSAAGGIATGVGSGAEGFLGGILSGIFGDSYSFYLIILCSFICICICLIMGFIFFIK